MNPAQVVDTGYRPHKHQAEIHRTLLHYRFAVLVCHRRFGKTVLAINTLIDAALRCKKQSGRYAYVAPYLKQAKQIAWLYLCQYSLRIPGTKKNESELYIEYPNGARITLYGADNAEAMRGIYLDGIVPDEMADYKPNVWGEIIRPALSDRKGWALFIGTPKGMNQFYELFQYAQNDPTWYAGIFRADETQLPWLDQEELALARNTMTDAQYRQEFLCDFAASADNTLITIDMVSAAAKKAATEDLVRHAPLVFGVDVARFGDDRSVLIPRRGLITYPPIVWQGVDNMFLAGEIARHINEQNPDGVFIDAGRGEGVIDRLRQLGYRVMEVNFGGKPTNQRYANKRSEMWDAIAEYLRQGGCLPNHTDLKTDLCVPTYKFDAANRMVLESKEKIKERGGRSPDLADALALTFAYPVTPHAHTRQERAEDYDPLAY